MIQATDGLCDRMNILGLIAPISRLLRLGSIREGESETLFRGAIRGHRRINRAQLISDHQATDRGINHLSNRHLSFDPGRITPVFFYI